MAGRDWTFEEAAGNAFVDNEEADKFVERLLGSAKDAAGAMAKSLSLLVITLAGFELLNRALVDSVSVGFLKINSPIVVATFLPTLSAYFSYQTLRYALRWRSLERAYTATMEVAHPGICAGYLDGFLVPAAPLLSTRSRIPRAATTGALSLLQHTLEGLFAIVSAFLLPFFQLYAFFQLYERYGGRIGFLFIAAAVGSAILTCTYVACLAILLSATLKRLYHDHYLREGSFGYRIAWWLHDIAKTARG